MSNKLKEMSNEELLKLLDDSIVESVKKQNSGIGTKGLNDKIEKMKKEILIRMNSKDQ